MLKRIIKFFIPTWFIDFLVKRKIYNPKSRFENLSMTDVFTQIYNENYWQGSESLSGSGSDTSQTEIISNGIGDILKKHDVKSILDIPCGDFFWMKNIDLSSVEYVGADIVSKLIDENKSKFGHLNGVSFDKLNLLTDELPCVELVLIRDCFVHFSFENITKAITNLKASGSKYLLVTTFSKHETNNNITTGLWRPLNMMKHPFNFPDAIEVLNEGCTEDHGKYADKSLGLWHLEDIIVN